MTSYVSGIERKLEKTDAGTKAGDGASLEQGSWTASSGMAYQGVKVAEYLPVCLVSLCSLPINADKSTPTIH